MLYSFSYFFNFNRNADKITKFVRDNSKMYPKISIITVVRNDSDGLKATLECLQKLHYDNLEIVLIDGASTDSTLSVAAQFMHSITKFISEPDRGIYDAMNKGLKMATGDYVWFVNAGDKVVDFEALSDRWISEEPLSDIYYGDTQIVSPDGEVLGLRRKKLPATLTFNSLKRGMVVCHQSFLVRRTIAPLYDTRYRYSADVQWMMDCLKASQSVCNIGAVLSEFRLGGATTTAHRKSLIERWHIMRRNYGVLPAIWAHFRFVIDAFTSPDFR